MTNKGLFSSKTDEWETPQDFFEALNNEFQFDIDVCATSDNAKCEKFFSPQFNALIREWHGVCWMNPPYDKNIGLWIQKAYETAQKGYTVVCLIQGRSSDTKWWHDYVMRASEIRYIKDRLHFGLNGKFSRANISSIIVMFGPFCQGPPKVSSINTKGEFINIGKS